MRRNAKEKNGEYVDTNCKFDDTMVLILSHCKALIFSCKVVKGTSRLYKVLLCKPISILPHPYL